MVITVRSVENGFKIFIFSTPIINWALVETAYNPNFRDIFRKDLHTHFEGAISHVCTGSDEVLGDMRSVHDRDPNDAVWVGRTYYHDYHKQSGKLLTAREYAPPGFKDSGMR